MTVYIASVCLDCESTDILGVRFSEAEAKKLVEEILKKHAPYYSGTVDVCDNAGNFVDAHRCRAGKWHTVWARDGAI